MSIPSRTYPLGALISDVLPHLVTPAPAGIYYQLGSEFARPARAASLRWPTGITFDESSRQIGGTPLEPGTFIVQYTGFVADAIVATTTFTITVPESGVST